MLTAPLDKLRNAKDLPSVWTKEHTKAVRKLKFALTQAPVLDIPNLNHPKRLVTDSSGFGVAACLFQVINGEIKYLGFVARSLSKTEQNWGSTKRELNAVCYGFVRFRQWLLGKHFHLLVDNKALLFLNSQEKISNAIHNWYETIFEMDFDITFCDGIRNILADHLSRLFVPEELEGEQTSPKKSKSKNTKKGKGKKIPFKSTRTKHVTKPLLTLNYVSVKPELDNEFKLHSTNSDKNNSESKLSVSENSEVKLSATAPNKDNEIKLCTLFNRRQKVQT